MLGLYLAAALAGTPAGIACADLPSLAIADTEFTLAVDVDAAPFVWPGDAVAPPGTVTDDPEPIPAHCRVRMLLSPEPGSRILVELWLPASDWNGKFLAVGNGGWAGAISGYTDMKNALRRGYATAATNTGHVADTVMSGMFTVGQPEKITDFAYRSVHLMAVRSKEIIIEHYRRRIHQSYFMGCSTGGRQGLMSATRYPGDFDGIIAGAFVNRHISMHAADMAQHVYRARHPRTALPAAKAMLVNDYVMQQCDHLGEGFLNNPRQCTVDYKSLQCGWLQDSEHCLTRQQLQTVEMYYGGVSDRSGKFFYPGFPTGNPIPELLSPAAPPRTLVFDSIRLLGFQDPAYDWRTFELERDLPRLQARGKFIETTDPDLRAYKAHGGKLIMYHGWNDDGVSAENSVMYYESVLAEMGDGQDDWMRLFMVPGMGHCRGGDGPHSFDMLTELERWREQGMAPDQIPGSNPATGLRRPLCPYPRFAEYNGAGDLADAYNWSCSLH